MRLITLVKIMIAFDRRVIKLANQLNNRMVGGDIFDPGEWINVGIYSPSG